MNDNINILVVDDNQENLRVVSNYLKEKSYRIALALDGKSALKIIEDKTIDLILLDVMMPEMDGFEVCEKLKNNPETKDIPIIFLTAKNETADIVKGFKIGGVDYITKPFQKEELLVRIDNHVQLKKVRDILKDQSENHKKSRDTFMKALYDLGKVVNKNE